MTCLQVHGHRGRVGPQPAVSCRTRKGKKGGSCGDPPPGACCGSHPMTPRGGRQHPQPITLSSACTAGGLLFCVPIQRWGDGFPPGLPDQDLTGSQKHSRRGNLDSAESFHFTHTVLPTERSAPSCLHLPWSPGPGGAPMCRVPRGSAHGSSRDILPQALQVCATPGSLLVTYPSQHTCLLTWSPHLALPHFSSRWW